MIGNGPVMVGPFFNNRSIPYTPQTPSFFPLHSLQFLTEKKKDGIELKETAEYLRGQNCSVNGELKWPMNIILTCRQSLWFKCPLSISQSQERMMERIREILNKTVGIYRQLN